MSKFTSIIGSKVEIEKTKGEIKSENNKIPIRAINLSELHKKIEGALLKQEGVEKATVLFNSSKVKVSFDPEKISLNQMADIIQKLGYPILVAKGA